ncbi:hypothetical protein Tco_0666788 [Tanacetum coccineum]
MAGSQFNKYRDDRVSIMGVMIHRVMLQIQGVSAGGNRIAGTTTANQTMVLDEEQLAFLADPGVAEGQDTQTTMPINELSIEQAFWLPISNPISEQVVVPPTPVKKEVPRELPTDAPAFKEFFEINNLKAQLKGKDMTISNLKKHIANLKGKIIADCNELVNKPTVLELECLGVISSIKASGSKPRSDTKKK